MRRITTLALLLFFAVITKAQNVIITTSQVTATVISCKPDTVRVVVKNNTNAVLTNHMLQATFTSKMSWSSLDTIRGKTTVSNPSGNNYRFTFSTIAVGDSVIFRYGILPNCSSIPNTPPTNGNGNYVQLTDSTMYSFLLANGNTYTAPLIINTISGNSKATKYSIDYPYLVNYIDTILNTPLTLTASSGDTFVRRLVYQNSGTASYDGRFVFKDIAGCNAYMIDSFKLYIGKIIVDSLTKKITSPAPLVFAASIAGNIDSFSVDLSYLNKTVFPLGKLAKQDSSLIVVEEKGRVVACLGTGCATTTAINWGCSINDICKKTIPANRTLTMNRYSPDSFRISRLLPAINYNSSNYDYYWDSKCMNDTTQWEYLLQNRVNGQSLYNIKYVLNNSDIRSYSFIDTASVRFNYVNSLTGSLTAVPLAGVSVVYDTLTVADFTNKGYSVPACLGSSGRFIQSLTITIPKMKANDKFLISFATFKCCPVDTFLFGNAKTFNHWEITAKGFSDCSSDSFYATSMRAPTNTPKLYATSKIISNHYHNGGSDLDLKQNFQPTITDMQGVAPNGCGTAANFEIANLQLTVSLADQQLFYDSATYGPYGIGQGLKNPHGQFRIDFVLPQGLQIMSANYSGIVLFSNLFANTWSPSSVTLNGTIVSAIFDIDNITSNALNGNGENFNNFFTSTKLIFPISPCCPAPPSSTCLIRTYFNPKPRLSCATCWIPMAEQSLTIHVHCPGCITPGVIVENADILRTNFGLKDANDDGFADNSPSRITPSYSAYNSINKRGAIVGDTLESVVQSHFQDGGSSSVATGFLYNEWQNYWNNHGFSNLEYKQLSFEQNIPNSNSSSGVNLTPLSDTFYFAPKDSNWKAMPLDVSNPTHLLRTGDVFFHKIRIADVRTYFQNDSIKFKPEDNYRFKTTYQVCGNPTSLKESSVIDYMYFTVSDTVSYPKHTDASWDVSGGYYETHHTVAPFAPNPDSLPPTAKVYAQCESNGSRLYFYPVKQNLTVDWFDTITIPSTPYYTTYSNCTKNVKAKVASWIEGNAQNAFPFEYRSVPGFNPYSPKKGWMKDATNGIQFNVKVPTGYNIVSYETNTDVYRYYSNSAKSQTKCVAPKAKEWINQIGSSPNLSYTFKDTFANAIGGFAYPSSANLDLTTTTAITTTRFGNLLGGDERFEQTLVLYLKASCTNVSDSTMLTDSTITVMAKGLGCGADSVILKGTPNPAFLFKPKPIITNTHPVSAMGVGGNFSANRAIFVANTIAENVFLYIDTTKFPTCFVLDSIRNASNLKLAYTVVDSFRYYKIGSLPIGTATLSYYGHSTCCLPFNGQPYIDKYIPYAISWSCDSFPTRVPPTANSCTQPILDSLRPRFYDTGLQIFSKASPSTYYACDTLSSNVCFQALAGDYYGQIRNNKIVLQMPANTTLLDSALTVSVGASAAVAIPTNKITTVDTTTTLDLNFPKMDTLFGFNGLDHGEKICFTFKWVPSCSYTGSPPTVFYKGNKFCGDSVSARCDFDAGVKLGSHCININVNEFLWSFCGGIKCITNITGGVAPYNYHWLGRYILSGDTPLVYYPIDTTSLCLAFSPYSYCDLIVTDTTGCSRTYKNMCSRCVAKTDETNYNLDGNNNAVTTQKDKNINIYPNPTNAKLTIETNQTEAIKIEVFSMLGAKVLEKTAGEGKTEMNLSILSKGTYILKITAAKEKWTRRIVLDK